MSILLYALGVLLALTSLATFLVTPFLVAHCRTQQDHGPGCWWCHPYRPGRRPRP